MEQYRVKQIVNKNIWEKFLISKTPGSFLQSWNWGEVNSSCGYKVIRVGFYHGSKLVGISQFIEQRAKRGKHFLVPGGPVIDWNNRHLRLLFKKYALSLCRDRGAWFVRIRPDLYDGQDVRKQFRDMGYISSPMHLHAENTWVLDISQSEADILTGMRKATRYLVKKAMVDNNYSVESTIDPKRTKVLEELQKATVRRHRFVGFSGSIFSDQLKYFGPDGQAKLFIAKYKNVSHAAAIIICYGDTAYYHHSASSDESKDFPISYRLQWEIIKDAKKRGIKYYNFWGISPEGKKNHRFYGVTIFKKGFGGEAVNWIHAQDLVYSRMYLITFVFELLRKVFRKL